jgi:hypothetical protein
MSDGYGWTPIEHRFIATYGPRLGAIGIALYVTLKSHLNAATGQCNPSHRRLAQELNLSRNTVKAHLRRLQAAKLIDWHAVAGPYGDQEAHAYRFLPVEGGSLVDPGGSVSDQGGSLNGQGGSSAGQGVGQQLEGGGSIDGHEQEEVNKKKLTRETSSTRARGGSTAAGGGGSTADGEGDGGEGRYVHIHVQEAVRGLHRCWWPLAEDTPRNGDLWDGLIKLVERAEVMSCPEALERVNVYYMTKPDKRPTTWQEAASAMRYGIQLALDDRQGKGRRARHAS